MEPKSSITCTMSSPLSTLVDNGTLNRLNLSNKSAETFFKEWEGVQEVTKQLTYDFSIAQANADTFRSQEIEGSQLVDIPDLAKRTSGEDEAMKTVNCSELQLSENFSVYATQAPLYHTIDDFWQTVFTTDVGAILNLAPISKGKDFYVPYFSPLLPVETHFFSITPLKTKVLCDQAIVITWLKVTNKATDEENIYRHILFRSWPLDDIPKTFTHIHYLLALTITLSEGLLIHCSYGCGRTGVFLTLLAFCFAVLFFDSTAENFNFSQTILSLRQQRSPNMLRRFTQYLTVRSFARHFKKNRFLSLCQETKQHLNYDETEATSS
ncbi:hypothetical protein PCE1_001654 [Barthelona sp. PCE]